MLLPAHASVAQTDSTSAGKAYRGLVVLKSTEAWEAETGCSPSLRVFTRPLTILRVAGDDVDFLDPASHLLLFHRSGSFRAHRPSRRCS
jgi:hypothetical protein